MDELIRFDNLKEVLQEYAIAVRNRYQDNLIDSDHVASENLLNSIDYIIETENGDISVSLRLEDYWKYVEYDTKPHFPPVDKILEWIKIKPVVPDGRSGRLPTENQLAYLIGRKIAREGTTGTHDLQRALDDINAEYEELIGLAINEDLKEMMDVIFSEFLTSTK